LIRLVEQELAAGVRPFEIIFTSFTRAAAAEARDRAIVKFNRYDPKDFLYFSTIHSICYRELGVPRDHLLNDRRLDEFAQIYKYPLTGLNPQRLHDDQDAPFKDSVLQTECDYCEFFHHWMRHRMLPFGQAFKLFMQEHPEVPVAFNHHYLMNYLERRNKYKEEQGGLVDYTDILEAALQREACPSGIRVVIRDEEQDSSPLLSKVADIWSRQAERTYLAGDPEQAIYNWSGADPELFMGWRADEIAVLKEGHRCSQAVTRLARVVQSRMKTRYVDDQFTPTASLGEYRRVGYVNWLELLKEQKSIFYLHRTRWLLSKSYQELMTAGIPFWTLRGEGSPLQNKKVYRPFQVCYQLLEGQAITASALADMVEKVSVKPWMTRGAKQRIKEEADEHPNTLIYMDQISALGFTPDFLLHLNKGNLRAILKGEPDDITYCERLYGHYGLAVFATRPLLQVGTYHSVKGMEAHTVVLNPEFTNQVRRGYSLNPEPEHRLMYVGVTRAKEKVLQIMGNGYVL